VENEKGFLKKVNQEERIEDECKKILAKFVAMQKL
jgi:hypothetical protein